MFAFNFVQVMANSSTNYRRKGDDNGDQDIPPQGKQVPPPVPNDPQVWHVTLEKFRISFNLLAKALRSKPIRR